MRRVEVSLDTNIGRSETVLLKMRNKFAGGHSICGQSESIHDVRAKQIRIANGERLREAVVPVSMLSRFLFLSYAGGLTKLSTRYLPKIELLELL